jgi:NADH-quinone oxidoreductase subunit E
MEIISLKTKKAIDLWLKKFPSSEQQSGVIYALKLVQEDNGGYLTEALMDAVAAYLNMPKIAVYEVASFYSMLELNPVGTHKICICTNISCMLSNSEAIVEHLEERLGITLGETTADGKFTLKSVECLAACGVAPVMQIGPKYYEYLTPERVDRILAELSERE